MSIPVRWLSENMAVAGQIGPRDVAAIAEMGFKSVICNRPNAEYGPDQPAAEDVQAACDAAGLVFGWVPVTPDGGTGQDAQAMGKLMTELPTPILAYCRTGNRCITLLGNVVGIGHAIP